MLYRREGSGDPEDCRGTKSQRYKSSLKAVTRVELDVQIDSILPVSEGLFCCFSAAFGKCHVDRNGSEVQDPKTLPRPICATPRTPSNLSPEIDSVSDRNFLIRCFQCILQGNLRVNVLILVHLYRIQDRD